MIDYECLPFFSVVKKCCLFPVLRFNTGFVTFLNNDHEASQRDSSMTIGMLYLHNYPNPHGQGPNLYHNTLIDHGATERDSSMSL